MRIWKIAALVAIVIIGIPVLMAIWSFAGSLVTTNDSTAVLVGFAIYAIAIGVFVAAVVAAYRLLCKKLSTAPDEE